MIEELESCTPAMIAVLLIAAFFVIGALAGCSPNACSTAKDEAACKVNPACHWNANESACKS